MIYITINVTQYIAVHCIFVASTNSLVSNLYDGINFVD